jgi:hypothetical protein
VWARSGNCTTYAKKMRASCPKSCRLCAPHTHLSCTVLAPTAAATTPILDRERDILRRFYNATNGPLWKKADYWCNANVSHCEWSGVTCEQGRVIKLELFENGLSGTIPAELGNLSKLSGFDFYKNEAPTLP